MLLVATGPRVELLTWSSRGGGGGGGGGGGVLTKAAFFQAPMLVTSVSVVKGMYILLGDVHQVRGKGAHQGGRGGDIHVHSVWGRE